MDNKEKAFLFFKDFVEKKGWAPTFQQIGDHVGVSKMRANQYFHENPDPYLEVFPPIKKLIK